MKNKEEEKKITETWKSRTRDSYFPKHRYEERIYLFKRIAFSVWHDTIRLCNINCINRKCVAMPAVAGQRDGSEREKSIGGDQSACFNTIYVFSIVVCRLETREKKNHTRVLFRVTPGMYWVSHRINLHSSDNLCCLRWAEDFYMCEVERWWRRQTWALPKQKASNALVSNAIFSHLNVN